jgi:hypothetical protein
VEGLIMDVIKFKALQEGDKVIKVSDDLTAIHVLKENGDYIVFKTKRDTEEGFTVCDFDVFIITKGIGAFEIIQDADPEDYLAI